MTTNFIKNQINSKNNISIRAMQGVLPEFTVKLEEQLNAEGITSDRAQAQIAANLGYARGHFLLPPDTVLDMMTPAIKHLLANENIKPSEIDAIISVTLSADYLSPGNSFILREDLGFSPNCLCLDLDANCTGIVNALLVASNLLATGACEKVLIVAGNCDRFSYYYNLNAMESMLCDGGCLVLLERNFDISLELSQPVFKFKSVGQFINNKPVSSASGFSLREPDHSLLKQIVPRIYPATLTNEYCFTEKLNGNSIKENFVFLKIAYLSNELVIECLKELLCTEEINLSDLSYGICSPWHKILVEQLNEMLTTLYEDDACQEIKDKSRNFFIFLNKDLGHITSGQAVVSICHNLNELPNLKTKPVFLASVGAGMSVGAAIIDLKSTNLYPTFIYEQQHK